jgi:hypothetical protein
LETALRNPPISNISTETTTTKKLGQAVVTKEEQKEKQMEQQIEQYRQVINQL